MAKGSGGGGRGTAPNLVYVSDWDNISKGGKIVGMDEWVEAALFVDPRNKIIDVRASGYKIHPEIAEDIAQKYRKQLGLTANDMKLKGTNMLGPLEREGFVRVRSFIVRGKREMSVYGRDGKRVMSVAKMLAKNGFIPYGSKVRVEWDQGHRTDRGFMGGIYSLDELL